jgi:hypothetical protein
MRKSPEFVPAMAMLAKVIAAVLPSLIATSCGLLVKPTAVVAKERLEGDTVKLPLTGVAPAPDNAMWCGLPLAESEMVMLAAREPTPEGVNITPIVQLADPGSVDPHV